jgi:predicted molibdopterin-dependent oxidoreductase YjgC
MTQQAQTGTMTIKIDGREVQAPRNATILEAAQAAGIYIPTLCYDPRIKAYGACRMCVVQQEGRPGFPASCVTPAAPDASYRTNTEEINDLRQSVLNLLMNEHPHGCLTCDRIVHCGPNDICLRNVSVTDRCVVCPQNQRCELQSTVEIVGVTETLLPYNYRQLPIRTEDPYIDRDYNLCIACARCVRICDEVIGAEAISMVDRGDRILPGTPNDVPLSDPLSGCIFCGACVDACPVGALTEKENKWTGLPDRTVVTVCTLCEIGCQVGAEMQGDKLLRTTPDIDGGANGGLACIRGKFQIADETRNEGRLLRAHVRRDGALQPVSWDEAVQAAAEGFRSRRGDAFALVVTPKVANEDAYLLQKFARAAMGSANVANTAQAAARTIADLTRSFGLGVSTNPIRDIAGAKAVLFVGDDLEVTHPVAAFQVHKAVNYQDAVLIGIGPERYKELGRSASIWLQCNSGTEPTVLAALLKVILEEGLADKALADKPVDGMDALVASLAGLTLGRVAADTGVSADDIRRAARAYAAARSAATVYSARAEDQGIVPLLADLALVSGNIGRSAGGVHVFRPEGGNVQGVYDMGCAPDVLPGYKSLTDDESRKRLETSWGAPIESKPGADFSEVIEGVLAGRIKALYWVGDVPAGLTESEAARLRQAFEEVEFLVAQGLAANDDLTATADVLLPATSATEREGTYTNAERRVQRVRPFLPAPGDARPVWQAPAAIAKALDAVGFEHDGPADIFDEIVQHVPQYTGLSYESLDARLTGPVWPLLWNNQEAAVLYTSGAFAHPDGRAKLAPAVR